MRFGATEIVASRTRTADRRGQPATRRRLAQGRSPKSGRSVLVRLTSQKPGVVAIITKPSQRASDWSRGRHPGDDRTEEGHLLAVGVLEGDQRGPDVVAGQGQPLPHPIPDNRCPTSRRRHGIGVTLVGPDGLQGIDRGELAIAVVVDAAAVLPVQGEDGVVALGLPQRLHHPQQAVAEGFTAP